MGRQEFDLTSHGINVSDVRRNLAPAILYAEAIREERDCVIADTGALIAYSGDKTGRSPKDKRIVEHPDSEDDVWWGPVNVPDRRRHVRDQPRARDRLPQHPRARSTVVDGFAGWDPRLPGQDPRRSARGPTTPCSCTTC